MSIEGLQGSNAFDSPKIDGGNDSPTILWDRDTTGQTPNEVLQAGIIEAALNGDYTVTSAIQSTGKSSVVAPFSKNVPVTVLTPTSDNSDEQNHWADEIDSNPKNLGVSTKDCDTISGSRPSNPEGQKAYDAYHELGWPIGLVHKETDCCSDGCGYKDKLEEIDSDGMNLLIGDHSQAYNRAYIDDRYVFIDEDAFDRFLHTYENPMQIANEFIGTVDEFPLDRFPHPLTEEKRKIAVEWLEENGFSPYDYTDYFGEFDVRAPIITYAVFTGEEMANGYYKSELPNNQFALYENPHDPNFTSNDRSPICKVFDAPDFSNAKTVIALDANANMWKWEAILGEEPNEIRLFNDEQRKQYLAEQGYEFRFLNTHVWRSQGGNISIDRCEAYLREIYRKHGKRPDLITSRAILGEKDDIEGLKDRELEYLWNEALYYGDVDGKNDIDDSNLLVVLGCPSRSDAYYMIIAGLFGECAEPATDESGERLTGYDLDYQGEIANSVLEQVTRGETFQAIMRAGRRDDSKTIVYIATGMIPKWLVPKNFEKNQDSCPKPRGYKEKQIIEALRGAEEVKTSEIYEKVDASDSWVRKRRRKLQKRGFIEKKGKRKGARYTDVGLDNLNIAGYTDLSLSPSIPLESTYMGMMGDKSLIDPRPVNSIENYPEWILRTQRHLRNRKRNEILEVRNRTDGVSSSGKVRSTSVKAVRDSDAPTSDKFGSWVPSDSSEDSEEERTDIVENFPQGELESSVPSDYEPEPCESSIPAEVRRQRMKRIHRRRDEG
jgi:hypothetical protein